MQRIFSMIKGKFDTVVNFIDLTEKTTRRLQEKLHQMVKNIRKCSGSRSLSKLLEKWKNTDYKFTITYRSRIRKLEEDLKLEQSKRMKLEKVNEKLKNENTMMRKQNMRLSMKLIKKACAILSTPKQKGREYSKSHARKLKKQLIPRC